MIGDRTDNDTSDVVSRPSVRLLFELTVRAIGLARLSLALLVLHQHTSGAFDLLLARQVKLLEGR